MNVLKNYKVFLVLAVISAVITGVLAMSVINNYTGTVKVAIAGHDITEGTQISATDLRFVDYPKGALYNDTVINTSIVGQVAKGFIPSGTVLRSSMFSSLQMAGITGKLKSLGNGYYAVSVSSNSDTTVAGTLQNGDRVDIYKVDKDNVSAVAKNIKVLQATITTSNGEQQSQGVVIAVNSSDLNNVLSALNSKLVFVLRPVGK
jgi:Flp pilus assembly protein CpaB